MKPGVLLRLWSVVAAFFLTGVIFLGSVGPTANRAGAVAGGEPFRIFPGAAGEDAWGPGALVIRCFSDKKFAAPGEKINFTVAVANTYAGRYSGRLIENMQGLTQYSTYNNDADYEGREHEKDPAAQTRFFKPLRPATDTWAWGIDILGGRDTTLTFSTTVKANAPPGAKLMNKIAWNGLHAATYDYQCDNSVEVRRPAGSAFTVRKWADKAVAKPGDTIRYTVTAKNATGAVYSGAIEDDLRAVVAGGKASYQADAKASAGYVRASGAGDKLYWNGSLPHGGILTFSYTVKVAAGAAGKLVNRVSTPAPSNCYGRNADPVNCSATVDLDPADPPIRLEVDIKTDKPSAKSGEVVTYTITARNNSASDYRGSIFGDMSKILDKADLQGNILSFSSGKAVFSADVLEWQGEVKANGGMVVISYGVRVKEGAEGELFSTVVVDRAVLPSGRTFAVVSGGKALTSNCAAGSSDLRCKAVVRIDYFGGPGGKNPGSSGQSPLLPPSTFPGGPPKGILADTGRTSGSRTIALGLTLIFLGGVFSLAAVAGRRR